MTGGEVLSKTDRWVGGLWEEARERGECELVDAPAVQRPQGRDPRLQAS